MAEMGTYTATNLPTPGSNPQAAQITTDMNGLIAEFNKQVPTSKISAEQAWTVWTPTLTGFSADPSGGLYRYLKLGRGVWLSVWMPLAGTSNATSFSLTAPFVAATVTGMLWMSRLAFAEDNSALSTTVYDYARISSASQTIDIYKNSLSTGWTASGTKRAGFELFYESAT